MKNAYFLKILNLCSLAGLIAGNHASFDPAQSQSLDYLQTDGERIVTSNGDQVILTGISWFGMETEAYAPHGLWARNWESILDQVLAMGFNAVRLPYSNELFEATSRPNGIDYNLNPDLEGLSGLEIMDKIIAGAGRRGLKVILDRHQPDSRGPSELWYTERYSEARWISDWVMLAHRYAGDDSVIGVDLHNVPHGKATWGTGDPATDWRLAAERAGNAILKVNPNVLILVQGVERIEEDLYWWGGNLAGAREHPVRLDVPGRLVYATHVFGEGVYLQSWFLDPEFPGNLPEVWDDHWAYLHHERIAPVIVVEFGGRSVGGDREGTVQTALVDYLERHGLSYFYWALNPNSSDTGGLLLNDWTGINREKLSLLARHQFPLMGGERPDQASVASGTLENEPTPRQFISADAVQPAEANQEAPAQARQAVSDEQVRNIVVLSLMAASGISLLTFLLIKWRTLSE